LIPTAAGAPSSVISSHTEIGAATGCSTFLQKNRVDPTHLTTHRFPFREVGRAFKMMRTKEDGILKPLILF
jgi:threonine dehydrogenase-like Zn-dependent dehydrogenase